MTAIESNLCTYEEKLRWWGDGPWINEVDRVDFHCSNYSCFVQRIFFPDYDHSIFGGYLNGYVIIPDFHILYDLKKGTSDDLINSLDVHGGVTFASFKDDKYLIGFDCAHGFDLIPSMKKFFSRPKISTPHIGTIVEKQPFHDSTYKTIDFCIEECKKLAEQINALDQPYRNVSCPY